ncbi:hypothetical protein THAOC_32636 [Thalassiosira oceanica]|uniref:Uncharacterized protein n=1 Tax=Thalassiosira oceanica TaxID=159749 RepID=K0RI05_THAOC|nr:hypothetical protein THAOC_32636 [Thalassiosira oceanica]|eukprot:EJK48556.1 hypothetical protein THAOC_32636 [Thalassiosira oceanica]
MIPDDSDDESVDSVDGDSSPQADSESEGEFGIGGGGSGNVVDDDSSSEGDPGQRRDCCTTAAGDVSATEHGHSAGRERFESSKQDDVNTKRIPEPMANALSSRGPRERERDQTTAKIH